MKGFPGAGDDFGESRDTSMAKIADIAKSFNIKSKDVVTYLKEHGIEKNVSGTIEGVELDLFLEVLMQANQIENLDEYMSGKATLKSDLPKSTPAAKAPAAKKEAPAPAPAPATPAPKKPAAPAKEEPRYTTPASRKGGADTARPAQRPERPAGARPAAKPQAPQPKKPINQADLQRRMEEFRANQEASAKAAKAAQREKEKAAQKAAAQAKPEEKAETPVSTPAASAKAEKSKTATQAQAPAQQPKKEFKPREKKEPVDRFSRFENKPQASAKKAEKTERREDTRDKRIVLPGNKGGEGEVVVTTAPKVRIVDTRTTQVDLSRYDEHIDTRYSGGKAELQSSRQKLKKQDNRSQGKAAKDKEKQAQERIKRMQAELARKKQLEITVPDTISVGELSSRMKKTSGEVIKKLMMMGTMVSVNQEIDFDTAYLVAEEFGVKVEREVVVTIEQRLFETEEDTAEDLVERSPVVCVMGHVDHGKTSLLDAIRHTSVTRGEAGGITQHIGAYRVSIGGKDLTFLDTPGHEAFTAMRARGAQATDIAILVVAADDGIMPQTIEAINHAKAAGIDIIVAINKMDKPQANPDQIMQSLTQYELVPEEWGGDVICVPVSAKTGKGIEQLLESVLLVAEVKELKANPNRRAKGLIIESRLDRGRGPVATVLVQNGTLHAGDVVIAGTAVGRVRAMVNENGKTLKEAGPSVPVEITGLAEVPAAGDEFNAVEDEKMARSLAEQRRDTAKQEEFKANARVNLDDLFSQISEGVKNLNVIIKADVGGSAEAVKQSLLKLSNDEVKVQILHCAVGGVTEGDVMLAAASGAIIVGFNVRPDRVALDSAERNEVDIRTYRVIYDCINEIEAAMKGMLAPKYREVLLGHAEVRQTIHVPNVGTIAGSYVLDGKIARHAKIRIVRDGVVISEDEISSLKRFKDDVKEVGTTYECGVGLKDWNDIQVGDILEAFMLEEIPR